MTVYVLGMTTQFNVKGSRRNGRYHWKGPSLADKYCNWYSCDWFNGYLFLRFIFWIRVIPIVMK
eukprot:Gb_23104 [translate_table: standard]